MANKQELREKLNKARIVAEIAQLKQEKLTQQFGAAYEKYRDSVVKLEAAEQAYNAACQEHSETAT